MTTFLRLKKDDEMKNYLNNIFSRFRVRNIFRFSTEVLGHLPQTRPRFLNAQKPWTQTQPGGLASLAIHPADQNGTVEKGPQARSAITSARSLSGINEHARRSYDEASGLFRRTQTRPGPAGPMTQTVTAAGVSRKAGWISWWVDLKQANGNEGGHVA